MTFPINSLIDEDAFQVFIELWTKSNFYSKAISKYGNTPQEHANNILNGL